MAQQTASPDPRAQGNVNEPPNRRPNDDIEHGTGQAGADGERERVDGTPNPGPDSIPTPGGATPGTTAGEVPD